MGNINCNNDNNNNIFVPILQANEKQTILFYILFDETNIILHNIIIYY